jgi:Holliday junction resolvase RusA-like endonuclease
MKLELCFDGVEPVSLNNSTGFSSRGKFTTKYKKDNYKILESKVNLIIRKYKNEINKFNKKYDENQHYLTADYRFYYPILIKSGKRISKTSKDWSNLPKTIEDCIHKQLVADDSQVISGSSTKIHCKEPRIEVDIYLRDLRSIL